MTRQANVRRALPHLFALLGLHIVVQLVLGSGLWTVDEGVYLMQSDWLTQGHWSEPIPQASFGGTAAEPVIALPVQHGTIVNGTDWIVYPRHPIYPVLLSMFERAGSGFGPFLLSILGSVLASILVAASVPHHRRFAFWLSAVGTSLFFHAHIVWAHSLGIAAAALTTLALVRHVRSGPNVWSSLGLLVGLALGSLMRTEGLIFAIAVVGVLGVDWLMSQRSLRSLATPLSAGTGLVLGFVIDTWWRASVLDGRVTAGSAVNLSAVTPLGRLGTLAKLAFGPGESAAGSLARLGLVVCVALAALGFPKDRRIPAAAFGAAALFGLAAFDSPGQVGLFVASPLLLFGVLGAAKTRESVVLGGVVGLTLIGVVGTMYAPDAGPDFGGRLFAMTLPALVIVAAPRLVAFVTDYGPVALVSLAFVVFPQMAGILNDVNDGHDLSNRLASEVGAFTNAHPGAIFIAPDVRTGRAGWQHHPTGIVTITDGSASAYLAGHTNGEIWVLGAGYPKGWLMAQIPVGWEVVGNHDDDLLHAVQIQPTNEQ